MKVGDNVPVTIAGQVVAQATVKEMKLEDGQATLVVPATLVVMAVRTELDSEVPEQRRAPVSPEIPSLADQHEILGVEERHTPNVPETNVEPVAVTTSTEIDATDAVEGQTTAPVEETEVTVSEVKPTEVAENE